MHQKDKSVKCKLLARITQFYICLLFRAFVQDTGTRSISFNLCNVRISFRRSSVIWLDKKLPALPGRHQSQPTLQEDSELQRQESTAVLIPSKVRIYSPRFPCCITVPMWNTTHAEEASPRHHSQLQHVQWNWCKCLLCCKAAGCVRASTGPRVHNMETCKTAGLTSAALLSDVLPRSFGNIHRSEHL